MSKSLRFVLWLSVFCLPFPLSAQLNLQQIGHLPYAPLTLAGCKAYVDSSGGEWALVGTSAGLSIVDLSNPAQPVERFAVPGLTNSWREVRTWKGFAYVGSEATGSGITIVDLRELPDTVTWKVWLGDGAYTNFVQRSHTVQAVDGYLYIFGGGNITSGCTIADLADPWNPHIIGKYTLDYVHDGFIRGDTLWTSEFESGLFGVVDLSDRTDPQLITTHPTPGGFPHNAELSDDNRILFTTDETQNAPLSAFDVSDLDNITLLDVYFPSQNPSKEVHNVRVKGNFLVNPSYGGQLTIVDATRPDNLIETGWAKMGDFLVWDADPYLPSGIVLATSKFDGLYVFQPTYQHAAWLEGIVKDSLSGQPLHNAKVFVLNTPNADTSKTDGQYKTGAALPGAYTVEVIRTGYYTKTIPNVLLQTNEVTERIIELVPLPLSAQQPDYEGAVRVSPSPFSDRLVVHVLPDSPFARETATVRLSDLSGKMIVEKAVAGAQTVLDKLSPLPSGTYLLTVQNGRHASHTVRVVK